jgi:hypothetical protein
LMRVRSRMHSTVHGYRIAATAVDSGAATALLRSFRTAGDTFINADGKAHRLDMLPCFSPLLV